MRRVEPALKNSWLMIHFCARNLIKPVCAKMSILRVVLRPVTHRQRGCDEKMEWELKEKE